MMYRNIYAACFLTTLFISGCSNDAREENPVSVVGSASPNQTQETSQDPALNVETTAASAPEAKSVLTDIYKQEVKDSKGYQLVDGRYVSYWNGRKFVLNGKNYFVAFSEATPASEIEYPTYEDKVTISQATYEYVGNQWELKNVQLDLGKFGGNNKAPMAEPDQKEQSFSLPSGRYFLALPSFQTAMGGISLSSLELFAFSEKDWTWQYLGKMDIGSDNSAGCAHEADSTSPVKCATSTGTLDFKSAVNEEWPVIKIRMNGTAVGAGGKIFELSEKDAREYRYDTKSSAYVETKR